METFTKIQLKKELPDIRPGDTVRVHQKIKEKNKERIQVFEGLVLARKHGKGISSTITVRKVISGIGVERIFPTHSPNIEKIEIIKRSKVRRAKLYYLREAKGKKGKLKRKEFSEVMPEKPKLQKEESEEKTKDEIKEQPSLTETSADEETKTEEKKDSEDIKK